MSVPMTSMESLTSSNELIISGLCFLFGACSTLMIWILSHFEFNTHFFDGNPFRSEKQPLSFEGKNDVLNNFSKEQHSTKMEGKNDDGINGAGNGGRNKKAMNEATPAAAITPKTKNQIPGVPIVKSSDKQIWSGSVN